MQRPWGGEEPEPEAQIRDSECPASAGSERALCARKCANPDRGRCLEGIFELWVV